jgi:hypothetical protein
MFVSKWLVPAVVALALGCAGPGLAVEPHAHGDKAAAVKLQLNHGKKWQTDAALRRGMSEIRAAMAEALTPIHESVFTPRNTMRWLPVRRHRSTMWLATANYLR